MCSTSTRGRFSPAGVAAGIDLCLHVVRIDHGAAAAGVVARRMVAAMHRTGGQAQFMQRPVPDGGQSLAATCEWAVREMRRPITVADLAAHAHFSARTLARRFMDETGLPPMRWLTLQRVLEARRLLEATDLPVEDIAQRCGLGTAGNLRLHLPREAATTPTAYRHAFRAGAGRNRVIS